METSGQFASLEFTLAAYIELVLQDQLQELLVAESVGLRLLQAHGQVSVEAGEAQLAKGGGEWDHEGKAIL